MFPQHVIASKRDGQALEPAELASFVRGATDGSWADYQLSAMLMAIFLRGMDIAETAALAEAMMRSGVVVDLKSVSAPKVDKHSTGGVGDKVSLHLAPMVAACGVAVPMVSGRGLGHSGGTLDKLESIAGFDVNLSIEQYRAQIGKIGCALIGQTNEIAPADKKLYGLRDVTGTVECIPLICASILSKKLSEGIDALVLDVKFGAGAFMKDKTRARELARSLVAVATRLGKPTRALLTSMAEPLGRTVGNALEMAESIACLRGVGPADVMEVTYALGEQMLLLGGVESSVAAARARLKRSIESGAALDKFREIVAAQGGDLAMVDDPGRLPQARLQVNVTSARDGFIADVNAFDVAIAALRLGAGRTRAEDKVDHAVGVSGLVKVGERVAPGEVLAVIHANDEKALEEARTIIEGAIEVGAQRVASVRLIEEMIG